MSGLLACSSETYRGNTSIDTQPDQTEYYANTSSAPSSATMRALYPSSFPKGLRKTKPQHGVCAKHKMR